MTSSSTAIAWTPATRRAARAAACFSAKESRCPVNVTTPSGTSATALAQRLPYPDLRMERLLVMNGVESPGALMQLPQIKTVVP